MDASPCLFQKHSEVIPVSYPTHACKLLIHKVQIHKLFGLSKQKGYSIVQLKIDLLGDINREKYTFRFYFIFLSEKARDCV